MARRRFLDIRLSKKSQREIEEIRKSQSPAAFRRKLKAGLTKIAQRTASHVVKTQLSGQTLARRTGQTARLIQGVAVFISGVPAIRVGILNSDRAVILAAHEFGATIKPVKAKALAQPLAPKALTPAGKARFESPTDFPRPLDFVPFKSGGPVIGALYEVKDLEKLDEQGTAFDLFDIDAVFLLRSETVLPERAPLEKGVRSRLDEIADELADLLAIAFGFD